MAGQSAWSKSDFREVSEEFKLGCSPNLVARSLLRPASSKHQSWTSGLSWLGRISSRIRSKAIVALYWPWIPWPATKRFCSDWSDRISEAPSDFVRRLLNDRDDWLLDEIVRVRIRFCLFSDGTGRLSICCRTNAHQVLRAIRSFDLDEAMTKHDYLRLRKRFRGKGHPIVAFVSQNLTNWYDHIGITKIVIEAGLESGGIVWAARGFRPSSDSEWDRVREDMRSRWSKIEDAVRRKDPILANTCDTILDSGTVSDILTIAKFDHMVTSPNDPQSSAKSIGAFLLAGTRWKGTLRLDDPDQRAVHDEYLAIALQTGGLTP